MEGTTAEALIEFAQNTIKANGLGVYQFHGIGGPLFQISKEAHLRLLKFLKENEDKVTVFTFADAMRSSRR